MVRQYNKSVHTQILKYCIPRNSVINNFIVIELQCTVKLYHVKCLCVILTSSPLTDVSVASGV